MERFILFCFLALSGAMTARSQTSYGGKPLPFSVTTRSMGGNLFVDMPDFDLAAEMRLDSIENNDLRGGYRFASKFMTDLRMDNSGVRFLADDGALVWRLGIRSAGALSMSVLFSEYELPDGAQVFLYNPAQTEVLGAFDHRNNSELGILPTAPLGGDELIVEYREPAMAAFRGKLSVGEVNHGFRSFREYEPKGDRSDFWCMPSPVCIDTVAELDAMSRSVALIVFDGVRSCTGALVNNTSADGKPYLLTASHCLNDNFAISSPDYAKIAGKVVCFFNYNSPTCDTVRRGAEEMSVASATYVAVNEKSDMALLELLESPPAYYRPFYAGWSIEENGGLPPYAVIHHPVGSVKRVNQTAGIALKTFMSERFNAGSHWNVARYTSGCTDNGSSGSPLFDSNRRIAGLLSGGMSSCSYPADDFYYAIFKAWDASANPKEQLKRWLDPSGSNRKTVDGLDPYADNPCYRLSNIFEARLNDSIETASISGSGNMFGINSLGTNEYLEEYHVAKKAKLEGVYMVTPALSDAAGDLKVDVVIYGASPSGLPQQLLHEEAFRPVYVELSPNKEQFVGTSKPLNRSQETFVRFSRQVETSGTFFAGYRITSPSGSSFTVYNLRRGQSVRNTAWLKYGSNWIPATQHPSSALSTSLFIDPVICYSGGDLNEKPVREAAADVFIGAGKKTLNVILYENNQGLAEVDVFGVDGRRLVSESMKGQSGEISAGALRSGIYIVNVRWGAYSFSRRIAL